MYDCGQTPEQSEDKGIQMPGAGGVVVKQIDEQGSEKVDRKKVDTWKRTVGTLKWIVVEGWAALEYKAEVHKKVVMLRE